MEKADMARQSAIADAIRQIVKTREYTVIVATKDGCDVIYSHEGVAGATGSFIPSEKFSGKTMWPGTIKNLILERVLGVEAFVAELATADQAARATPPAGSPSKGG
jgi:hypothetical protein